MQSVSVARSMAKFNNLAHIQRRSITQSAVALKALPFFLNTYRKAQDDREPESGNTLRMLMFGKPGAGKGTLTARLVKKYDILSLSTGDLLRQHIAERTEVGREAEEIVACGGLLPDEVMLKVVTSKLDLLHNKVCHSVPFFGTSHSHPSRLAALDIRWVPSHSGSRRTSRLTPEVGFLCCLEMEIVMFNILP